MSEVLKGKVEWLLRRPDKFMKHRFNFYPASPAVRKQIKDLGLRNKLNENKDGELFYKFQSAEGGLQPIKVFTDTGAVYEGAVGNGSEADVYLTVEKFTSEAHGEVTRSFVSKVVITNLVEYQAKTEKTEAEATTSDLPV